MRAARPVIGAVILVGVGLGLILAYCNGNSGLSAAYPLAGSKLHVDLTLTGPAALGGVACLATGALLLIWAFFAAFVDLFTGTDWSRERVVERYSVVPAAEGTVYADTAEDEQRGHVWSRPSSRSHI